MDSPGVSGSFPTALISPILNPPTNLHLSHTVGAALSAKAVFKPTKEFHTAPPPK